MFLKKLVIYAFKTFADKTELEFGPGVTAVVGPNGCGKSNISDAIAWVLGEQSPRHLRGNRMEDVIFGGTTGRRPLNLAEVTLILDNSDGRLPLDYEEVSITRRLYRSGESEYLLNKVPCRLRDINDLLLDTGLGKEAYAFITQGEVDALLNSRPEDRRTFFEEAAGVQKYKYRKREALRKLDATHDNLTRLDDIIIEIERQISPLEEDARRAEEYITAAGRLKTAQLDLFVHRIAKAEERLDRLTDQAGAIEVELGLRQGRMQMLETEMATARIKLAGFDDEIEGIRSRLQASSSEADRCAGEYRLLDERLLNQQTRLAELKRSVQEAVAWCAVSEKEIEATVVEADTMDVRSAAASSQESEMEQHLQEVSAQIETFRERIEDIRQNSLGAVADIAGMRSRLVEMEGRRNDLAERLAAARGRLEMLQKEHQEGNLRLAEISAEVEAVDLAMAAERQKSNEKLAAITAGEDALRVLEGERQGLQQRAAALQARFDALREMERNLEGYYQGVKSVIGWKRDGRARGIIGTVADILKVSGRYELAVETALGASVQHIITSDDVVAGEMIALLKERKAGRATFMPLNMVQSPDRSLWKRFTGRPGVIGRAADMVEFDEAYRQVIELLLGHILVISNLEAAVDLSRANRDLRMVTLDGESISPGGLITGGSSGKRQNLLGRDRELEELQRLLNEASASKLSIDGNYASVVKEIEAHRHRAGEIAASLETLVRERNRLISLQQEISWRQKNASGEQDRANGDIQSILAEALALDKGIDMLGQELRLIESGSDDIDATLQEYLQSQAVLEQKRKDLQERLAALRIEMRDLSHARDAALRRGRELRSEMLTRKDFIAGSNDIIEKEMAALEETESNRSRTALLQDDAIKARNELAALLESHRAARQGTVAGIDELESETNTQRRSISDIESRQHRLELQAARLEADRDALCQRLQDDYHIEYNVARIDAGTVESEAQLAAEVEDLRALTETMGPVNMKARAELDEITERYDALSLQRDDLTKARDTLLQAIDEIDKVTLMKFTATFKEVAIAFRRIFERLFGGGEADIYLQDQEDPLNCGIEIVSRPPGKRMQNLSLLSGGEKALTVIALLFAVLEVKPSPFCVFDEVEAALDEANVDRFGEVLREFAGRTQFIVITHNKGTMETSDVIYGVTMSEPGVSQIVSVRMVETKPA